MVRSGISGIVRLCRHRATQVSYAVKCLDLALIDSDEGLRQLKEEIYIMCQLVSLYVKLLHSSYYHICTHTVFESLANPSYH